jgi:hypothetical protein
MAGIDKISILLDNNLDRTADAMSINIVHKLTPFVWFSTHKTSAEGAWDNSTA